jgi:hypothetical protein
METDMPIYFPDSLGNLNDEDRQIQNGITDLREALGRCRTTREYEALMRRQEAITSRWESLVLATKAAWELSMTPEGMTRTHRDDLRKRLEAGLR